MKNEIISAKIIVNYQLTMIAHQSAMVTYSKPKQLTLYK